MFLALIKCIRWEIAKIVVPRLFVVIFNMAQPFLLSRAIVYFGSTGSRLPRDTAGDLIRDSAIVFIGIAVSCSKLWAIFISLLIDGTFTDLKCNL